MSSGEKRRFKMNFVLKEIQTDYTQDEAYKNVKKSAEKAGFMIVKEEWSEDGSLVLTIAEK